MRFIIIILTFSTLVGYSQENNKADENNGFVKSVALEYHRNLRNLDFSELNTRLTDLNLSNSFSENVSANYIGIVWNFNFLKEKTFLGLYFSSVERNTSNNAVDLDSKLRTLRADLGYKLFTNNYFTLSFTAGLIFDQLSLDINNTLDSSENFDEAASTYNNQRLENNELISINLGPRFTYYIFKNLGVFASFGYQFQLNDSGWKSNDIELVNAPDLKLDSFFANLGITYRFINN